MCSRGELFKSYRSCREIGRREARLEGSEGETIAGNFLKLNPSRLLAGVRRGGPIGSEFGRGEYVFVDIALVRIDISRIITKL